MWGTYYLKIDSVPYFKFVRHNLNFLVIFMFVTHDLQTMFDVLHAAPMSLIYVGTQLHVPNSIASLVIANRLKKNFPYPSNLYNHT